MLINPQRFAFLDTVRTIRQAFASRAHVLVALGIVAVIDWDGNVLKEGSNGYTCMPSPPTVGGPMCLENEWMRWAEAWQNKAGFTAEALGISYMLAGDGNGGSSNIDPFAEGPTDDNKWVSEGAHLMILAPPALLESFPADPDNGGPYAMWKGTPYAHLMVPIGARD